MNEEENIPLSYEECVSIDVQAENERKKLLSKKKKTGNFRSKKLEKREE